MGIQGHGSRGLHKIVVISTGGTTEGFIHLNYLRTLTYKMLTQYQHTWAQPRADVVVVAVAVAVVVVVGSGGFAAEGKPVVASGFGNRLGLKAGQGQGSSVWLPHLKIKIL